MPDLNKFAVFLCIGGLFALMAITATTDGAVKVAEATAEGYWNALGQHQANAVSDALAVLPDEQSGAFAKEHAALSLYAKGLREVTQVDIDRYDEVWGRILSAARAAPVPPDEKKAAEMKAHLESMEREAATIPWRKWQVQMRAREFNDKITNGGPYQAYAKAHDMKTLPLIEAKPQ